MTTDHPATELQVVVRADETKLFASLELSKSRWLVTVSAPDGEKLSKHAVTGGDGRALLDLLARVRAMAARGDGGAGQHGGLQEAAADGFGIDRRLGPVGIGSHGVHPASRAVDGR